MRKPSTALQHFFLLPSGKDGSSKPTFRLPEEKTALSHGWRTGSNFRLQSCPLSNLQKRTFPFPFSESEFLGLTEKRLGRSVFHSGSSIVKQPRCLVEKSRIVLPNWSILLGNCDKRPREQENRTMPGECQEVPNRCPVHPDRLPSSSTSTGPIWTDRFAARDRQHAQRTRELLKGMKVMLRQHSATSVGSHAFHRVEQVVRSQRFAGISLRRRKKYSPLPTQSQRVYDLLDLASSGDSYFLLEQGLQNVY